jgi:LPS sulfotransferase NodH
MRARGTYDPAVRPQIDLAALLRPRERVLDVRRRIELTGVNRSYFICSTPRTGSTMLADVLARSGTVGLATEIFNPVVAPRGRPMRVGDYLLLACTRKSARRTGVFGIKLHWTHHELLIHLLRGLRGSKGLPDSRLVESVFPRPRYVWLTREDEVAQAVSWHRAKATRVWLDDAQQLADPVFDYEAIDERLRLVREHNARWREWFEDNEVEPFAVSYEQLVGDPAAVALATVAHLGVGVAGEVSGKPHTRRQADALNAEWARRYREQAAGARKP